MNETAKLAMMTPAGVVPASLTPMDMLRIAVERNANLDQLEKLMALQERWEANEARKAFVQAVAEFKAHPPTVRKNKRAGFESRRTGDKTEYEYATLDTVVDAIGPALANHGLSHRWATEQSDAGLISVTCTLTHVMGHSESVTLRGSSDQSGSKNNIQAIGSTVSYLSRYTLLAVTGLAVHDMDDDGAGPVEFISADQKETLIQMMKSTGSDTSRFLAYLGVPTLDEIPLGQFDRAVAALEKKAQKA